MGYRSDGKYCISSGTGPPPSKAIIKNGPCPVGYRVDGRYCVSRSASYPPSNAVSPIDVWYQRTACSPFLNQPGAVPNDVGTDPFGEIGWDEPLNRRLGLEPFEIARFCGDFGGARFSTVVFAAAFGLTICSY